MSGVTEVGGVVSLRGGGGTLAPGDIGELSVQLVASMPISDGTLFAIRDGGRTVLAVSQCSASATGS